MPQEVVWVHQFLRAVSVFEILLAHPKPTTDGFVTLPRENYCSTLASVPTQLFPSTYTVVTNCTSRKRLLSDPITLGPVSLGASTQAIVQDWMQTLAPKDANHVVSSLYVGRSISEASWVAKSLEADLYVISAGVGLVHQHDKVPAYDLTFADPAAPLATALAKVGATPTDWWFALHAARIGRGLIADLVRKAVGGLVMLASPSGYLEMVAPDLDALPDRELERIRIFTSTAGASALPERIRRVAMPYDERLESLHNYAGTRTDFPQRAMRHFVETMGAHQLDLTDAKRAVLTALADLELRATPNRARLPDDAIARLLHMNWDDHRGSSSRLLRFLRQHEGVACEQGRFRDIWRSVKTERAMQGACA